MQTGLSPPANIFTDCSNVVLLLWIICVILWCVLCLSCFRVCSLLPLRSPFGKGLTSWLSFVMFNCVFVTLPPFILSQIYTQVSFNLSCPHIRKIRYKIFRNYFFSGDELCCSFVTSYYEE